MRMNIPTGNARLWAAALIVLLAAPPALAEEPGEQAGDRAAAAEAKSEGGTDAAPAKAEAGGEEHDHDLFHAVRCWRCFRRRDTLTDNWFGLGETLDEHGLTLSLSLTNVYQVVTHGGAAMRARTGRHSGSWDLELEADLEKILSLPGATVYVSAEGSWRNGIDPAGVGSVFGVNADAAGNRSIDVTQVYYEQMLFGEKVRIRVGKLDIGGGFECRGCPVAFDGNTFANDETAQFLNAALVNNPTIPMPDLGLGAVVYVEPVAGWYLSAGVADAQADGRETGFRTAFHREDYFFSIYETGVAPRFASPWGRLQGTYRIGMWYDPQDKPRFTGSTKRDDTGLYVSADQVVFKENKDQEDTQGLGLFARCGYADHEVSAIKAFWSVGGQYQGLFPTRDDDVLGFGVAQGRLEKEAGFTEGHETVMEWYYNVAVTGWLSISPSVQYILHPGGMEMPKDAVVFGIRAQMSF